MNKKGKLNIKKWVLFKVDEHVIFSRNMTANHIVKGASKIEWINVNAVIFYSFH